MEESSLIRCICVGSDLIKAGNQGNTDGIFSVMQEGAVT